MFENLNSIAGFNVSAILFATIFALICFFIAKYILSPVMGPILNFFEFIYDNILEPIINIFNNKNKQTSLKNTNKNTSEKDLLERTFSLILDWFSKGFITKLLITLITFVTLNYLLICLEDQRNFLSFNLKANKLISFTNKEIWGIRVYSDTILSIFLLELKKYLFSFLDIVTILELL